MRGRRNRQHAGRVRSRSLSGTASFRHHARAHQFIDPFRLIQLPPKIDNLFRSILAYLRHHLGIELPFQLLIAHRILGVA